MDDVKRTSRDIELKIKKTARGVGGTDLNDRVGNAGDEIRKDLGNAGDEIRKGQRDERQTEAGQPEEGHADPAGEARTTPS